MKLSGSIFFECPSFRFSLSLATHALARKDKGIKLNLSLVGGCYRSIAKERGKRRNAKGKRKTAGQQVISRKKEDEKKKKLFSEEIFFAAIRQALLFS